MYLIFVDDARQKPSRPGIKGHLVAAGAIAVPADRARQVEKEIAAISNEFGFPAGEEFKWSPRRGSWMFDNLHGEDRVRFFSTVIDCLRNSNVFAVVVMEDDGRSTATPTAPNAERDVVVLLLERLANRLKELRETGLLVADRPGGDRREEDRFVAECLTTLEQGTTLRQPRGDCVRDHHGLTVRTAPPSGRPGDFVHYGLRRWGVKVLTPDCPETPTPLSGRIRSPCRVLHQDSSGLQLRQPPPLAVR